MYVFVICVQTISTTHLLGSTRKPLGGKSFCQSTATPSLAHSLAHAISTSSGAAFAGAPRDPRSSPGSSPPSPRPCPLRGSPRPATDDERRGEPLVGSPQQRLDPLVIHHLGAVDLGLEHQALGVHQQVTLTALDLLASVVTALSPPTAVLLTDWVSTTPALG